MAKKSSTMVTVGGIMSAFGTTLVGIPIGTTVYYAQVLKTGMPPWFSSIVLPMILAGFVLAALGQAIQGVCGKGQDDVDTLPEVMQATQIANVEKVISGPQPAKVIPPGKQ